MGSRICRVQIFAAPSPIFPDSSDRGGGSDLPSASSIHSSTTVPDCTSTSTRPRTSSISVSSPLDLTACARLGEGDRTKETQTLGSFGPIVCCIAVENSPFHGFTNARHQYGDLKRCGDFDCFVS